MPQSSARKIIVAVGSWVTLILGGAYAGVFFFLVDDFVYLAVGISLFAVSLSIRAYGAVTTKR